MNGGHYSTPPNITNLVVKSGCSGSTSPKPDAFWNEEMTGTLQGKATVRMT